MISKPIAPVRLADMHVHSAFSVDSTESLDAMCQAALEKGLGAICFAEHLDLDPRDEGYGYMQFERFSAAVDAMRRRFGDALHILKGLEIGEPHLYPHEMEWAQTLDLDVILGSIHWIPDGFVGDRAVQERLSLEGMMDVYYRNMHQAVRWGGFDVLAHLDFPKRYLGRLVEPPIWLDDLLGDLVRAGIALEINTSPLRKGLFECSPDFPILTRYAHIGGARITLGSDAHSRGDVGADLARAQCLAESAGLEEIGLFERRRFVPSHR